MKKTGMTTVIIYALCAAVWSIRAVLEVVYQTYKDSIFWFVLNILCAVIWIAAFIKSLMKYRSGKES